MYTKTCRICDETFEAKTNRRELCDVCQKNSAKAQREINKAVIVSKVNMGELPSQSYHLSKCKYCGKEWNTLGHAHNYCSALCRQQYNIENARCSVCGALLYPLGIICKNGKGTCSPECKEKQRWGSARLRGKVIECAICKNEFIGKSGYETTCSRVCEKANELRIHGSYKQRRA